MAQTIVKYKVLVASPSDVADERETMNEVIAEINNTYGSRENIILELVKWESHSAPGISETDVQDLIDEDLGIDYDLFIGILWKKFGTPTKKFGSGTEQEFRRAHSKFKENPKSIQILFYFKNAPVAPSEIDPEQLIKINHFKSEIGNEGLHYWGYNTVDELQKFLRIHIPKRIDQLRDNNKNSKLITNLSNETAIQIPESELLEEELGVIDYLEIIEESFGDSTQAMTRIGEATGWIGQEMNRKTNEINTLTARHKDVAKKTSRDLFRRIADVMNDFASRIEPDIPIFIHSFEKGVNALSNLVNLYRSDFDGSKEEDIQVASHTLTGLIANIEGGLASMKSFLNSVSTLPRMERELNKARRNVETKLGDLINTIEVSHSIANELQKNLTTEN